MRSNAVYRIQIGPPDRPRLGSIWLDSPHDDLDDPILCIGQLLVLFFFQSWIIGRDDAQSTKNAIIVRVSGRGHSAGTRKVMGLFIKTSLDCGMESYGTFMGPHSLVVGMES